MKKLLLFMAGISILFFAGCYNGNQSHGNEGMGDSLPADPPLGYVIELKPLGNFSRQKAEQLREELVKQLGFIFNKLPKAELEASVFVGDKKEIPASCLYKPRNRCSVSYRLNANFYSLKKCRTSFFYFFSVSHSFLFGHVFNTLHFFFKFTCCFAIENWRFFDWSCHIYILLFINDYDFLQKYD